jgi:hypothetical protein
LDHFNHRVWSSKTQKPGNPQSLLDPAKGMSFAQPNVWDYNMRPMFKGLMDWYLAKLTTGGYPLIALLMTAAPLKLDTKAVKAELVKIREEAKRRLGARFDLHVDYATGQITCTIESQQFTGTAGQSMLLARRRPRVPACRSRV